MVARFERSVAARQSWWAFPLLSTLAGMVQGGARGPDPVLVRQPDPAPEVRAVFRGLRGGGKIRRHPRTVLFAATIALTGSSRNAILSVMVFFVVGGWILRFAMVKEGQQAAREG
jgi:UMF1 family MFS transporter